MSSFAYDTLSHFIILTCCVLHIAAILSGGIHSRSPNFIHSLQWRPDFQSISAVWSLRELHWIVILGIQPIQQIMFAPVSCNEACLCLRNILSIPICIDDEVWYHTMRRTLYSQSAPKAPCQSGSNLVGLRKLVPRDKRDLWWPLHWVYARKLKSFGWDSYIHVYSHWSLNHHVIIW